MIIIVDAYNILKYLYQDKLITEKQRSQFIEQLIKYGKKKRHEVLVVFDGGQYGLSDRSIKKPVTIIYTGAQERADDYIIRQMEKYKNYDVLIVSTDREITLRAEKQNIPFIDAPLFYTFVCKAFNVSKEKNENSKTTYKLHTESNPVVDELMYSIQIPTYLEKDDCEVKQTVIKGKKLSKNERRLMNVVDKL